MRTLRWALRKETGTPPRHGPLATVAGVTAASLLIGVMLGAGLLRSGLLDRDTAQAPNAGSALVMSALPPEDEGTAAATSYPHVIYEEPLGDGEAAAPSDRDLEAALREAELNGLAAGALPAEPLWERHAVPVEGALDRPMIAIVVDDIGINRVNSRRAIALPGPLTLSFLTYAGGLEALTGKARDAGHELLLHVPMEPSDPIWDPGPNVLATGLAQDELQQRLDWALARFDGYVGINNHMGSKFTSSLVGMAQVMAELRARGLIFLDSLTSRASVGMGLARLMGVAHTGRDVFLDNQTGDLAAIRRQLAKLEAIARRGGSAVGLAHPHDATLDVLAEWLPGVEQRGFALVPISAVVRREMQLAENRPGG